MKMFNRNLIPYGGKLVSYMLEKEQGIYISVHVDHLLNINSYIAIIMHKI